VPEIEAACNAIAHAVRRNPRPDHRHRIEHCSVCPQRLLRRIADLGITVVTQPSFIYFSGDRYLKTVPEDQRAHLYAIGSMLRHGLHEAFSSDFPISNASPMVGIQAAVTRMTEEGKVLSLQERISVLDALRMYTHGAAAANFEDEIKGSITPGKLADFVVLSEDPCMVDPVRIKDIRAVMTMLGGRIVWSEAAFSF
jgi:predicted amidohydrolase YtcJ